MPKGNKTEHAEAKYSEGHRSTSTVVEVSRLLSSGADGATEPNGLVEIEVTAVGPE